MLLLQVRCPTFGGALSTVNAIREALEAVPGVTRSQTWNRRDGTAVWPEWLGADSRLVQAAGPQGGVPAVPVRGLRAVELPVLPDTPRIQIDVVSPAQPDEGPARRPAKDVSVAEHSPVIMDPWRRETSRQDPTGWADSGTEALAWYLSFHESRAAWGIFIRTSGIERVASMFEDAGLGSTDSYQRGHEFLLRHELGHFQVDLVAAGLELAARRPFYLPGRSRQGSRHPGYAVDEEALCTALALEAQSSSAARRQLRAWLEAAPPGYRDHFLHRAGNRQNAWNMVVGDLVQSHDLQWVAAPSLRPALRREVPVYFVADVGTDPHRVAEAFLGPIVRIDESRTFLKDLRTDGTNKLKSSWDACRKKLAAGNLAGVHFESLGRDRRRYSARLSQAARVGLVRHGGRWTAVLADADHDRFYTRFERMDV